MKNLGLTAKILLIVFVFAGAGTATVAMGLWGMQKIDGRMTYLVETVAPRVNIWMEMQDDQKTLVIEELLYLQAKEPSARQAHVAQMDKLKAELDDDIQKRFANSPESRKASIQEYQTAFNDWWSIHLQVRQLVDQGKAIEAQELGAGKGHDAELIAEAKIKHMVDLNDEEMKSELADARGEYDLSRNMMFTLAAAVSVVGFGLTFLVLRQVIRSIDSVIHALEANSTQVGTASTQIASSSASLSQAATEQAASLQETAASVEELTSMVQRNMENAKRASEVSHTSEASAQHGKEVVERMSNAISEINQSNQEIMEQVESSNRQISEITKVIAEIGDKTKVINDIVFQTKLLSFNASVEAARAGEHGKGFAVVAEEVGNLAQMSGNAAKEISTMLDESIRKVENIVNDTKSSVERLIHAGREKVEVGTRIAQECGSVLDEIVNNITEVARMSTDIAVASQEQSQGVQEINKAVGQLDQVTHTNASAAEQTANSAEQLANQAKSLDQAVASLIFAVRGSSGQARPAFREAPGAGKKKLFEKSKKQKAAPQASAPSEAPKKAVKPAKQKKAEAPKQEAQPSAEKSNVIAFPGQKEEKAPVPEAAPVDAAKKAAGSDLVPSEDDPRFKDI